MSNYFVRPSGQKPGQYAVYKVKGTDKATEVAFGTEMSCIQEKARLVALDAELDYLIDKMEMKRREAITRKHDYMEHNPTDKETERVHNAYIDGFCAALSIVYEEAKQF